MIGKDDIVAVLEKLQQMNLVRLHKITGNYYTIYCPFHNGGQERRPSCGVLLTDEYRNRSRYPAGFTHCFTCGYAKSLLDFVSDLLKEHSITKSGLEWLQENIPGFIQESDIELLIPENLMESVNDKFAVDYLKSLQVKPTTYITEEELASYRFTVPYMYERKLTDPIIEKYDVGFDPNFIPEGRKRPIPCITFPVRDKNGNTLFIYRRSIETKFFSMPESIEKPVYGLDMISPGCQSLCICESIINALTLESWGYESVALLGTGTPFQIQQIKELGVREIVLCLDGDEAGHRGTAKLKRNLSSTAMVWVVDIPSGKDVNDLDKQTFDKLYSERE